MCIALHFFPMLDGLCLCQHWFSGALSMYVLALFGMKFVYLERMKIINANPLFESSASQLYIQCMTVLMLLCLFACLYLTASHTYGECRADSAQFGREFECHFSFDSLSVIIAMTMIAADTVFFALFCRKWLRIVKWYRVEHNHRIPADVVKDFVVQFFCVVIAMSSCVVDGAVSLAFQGEFDTMLVFVLDCSVIATCNFWLLKRQSPMCASSNSLCAAAKTTEIYVTTGSASQRRPREASHASTHSVSSISQASSFMKPGPAAHS